MKFGETDEQHESENIHKILKEKHSCNYCKLQHFSQHIVTKFTKRFKVDKHFNLAKFDQQ
jgi:hypothetical protein